jgi:hypothetical protein
MQYRDISEDMGPRVIFEGLGAPVVGLEGFHLPVPGDVHDLEQIGPGFERAR